MSALSRIDRQGRAKRPQNKKKKQRVLDESGNSRADPSDGYDEGSKPHKASGSDEESKPRDESGNDEGSRPYDKSNNAEGSRQYDKSNNAEGCVINPQYAICGNIGYGPTFGGGHDIWMGNNSNQVRCYSQHQSYEGDNEGSNKLDNIVFDDDSNDGYISGYINPDRGVNADRLKMVENVIKQEEEEKRAIVESKQKLLWEANVHKQSISRLESTCSVREQL
ncbi:hypothetical protein F8M41_021091 [Gigaspora margarita]|uniref:Uncharacterized protein n=1 Tax=Gigaspora margarita TaxID=4874 RepID=A0A8H4AHD0_GIGMA|nr:hypothetical protein F8M41_021091 [Gigaspora margarita]